MSEIRLINKFRRAVDNTRAFAKGKNPFPAPNWSVFPAMPKTPAFLIFDSDGEKEKKRIKMKIWRFLRRRRHLRQLRKSGKKYYANHKSEAIKRMREWQKNNPEQVRLLQRRYYLRKKKLCTASHL